MVLWGHHFPEPHFTYAWINAHVNMDVYELCVVMNSCSQIYFWDEVSSVGATTAYGVVFAGLGVAVGGMCWNSLMENGLAYNCAKCLYFRQLFLQWGCGKVGSFQCLVVEINVSPLNWRIETFENKYHCPMVM